MSAEVWAAIQKDIGEAISAAVSTHERGMATRWLVIAESLGPDGEAGVFTVTNEGLKAYEALGLLAYAHDAERAALTAERVKREMEGE